MKPIRVALLDDHEVVRQGLIHYLNKFPDLEIVGDFESSHELMQAAGSTSIDVLLLDFVLGHKELDGVSLIRSFRTRFPSCRILVLSAHDTLANVSLILRVGAHGFISKNEGLSSFPRAIRQVASNATYLSSEMSHKLSETNYKNNLSSKGSYDNAHPLLSTLSAREQEVIRCFLTGMTISEIAAKFNRSIKTISTQKNSAFRKLGVSSNNGLFKVMKRAKQVKP